MKALIMLLVGAVALQAQTLPADTTRLPQDSVIQRARQLVLDGNAVEGRRIIDSVLNAVPPESAQYADALYWRAALASTAADAERDYRRLLIEAPLSARAEDALLQLAQLEHARGDRDGAAEHLRRFMLSYANHPARPRVAVWLVRLLFEQGPSQITRACEALRSGREEIPADNAELRNQLEFYAPRCMGVAAAPPASDSQPAARAVADSQPTARARTDSGKRDTKVAAPRMAARAPTPKAPAASAFYSVQVAAYDTREAAARLVGLLESRGLAARVDGTARPFRVRVGRYQTRAAATKAAASLKAQGYAGFVALVRP